MIFDVRHPDAPFRKPLLSELHELYKFEKYDGSEAELADAINGLDAGSGLVVQKKAVLSDERLKEIVDDKTAKESIFKKKGPFRRLKRPMKEEAIENRIHPSEAFDRLFDGNLYAGYMWWGTSPRQVKAVPLVSLIEGYELWECANSYWSEGWHGHEGWHRGNQWEWRSYDGKGDYRIGVVRVPSRSTDKKYMATLRHIPIGERAYGELWDLFSEHDCNDAVWHGFVHFRYAAGIDRFCPHVIAAYLKIGREKNTEFFPYPFPAPDRRAVDYLDRLRCQMLVYDEKKKAAPPNKLQQEVMIWRAGAKGLISFSASYDPAKCTAYMVKIDGLR